MIKYICKRTVFAIFVVFCVACLTFFLMHCVPGGPFVNEKATPETIALLNAKYGLDKPLPVQLVKYLGDAVHGDFGISLLMQKNRPVTDIILEMFPTSAKIGGIAMLLAILIGTPMGCIAAYNRGNKLDSVLRVVTTLGISIPGFVVATVLLVIFGVVLGALPVTGLTSWTSYILPCFSLAFSPMCYIGRLSRSSMLDVINQDYIRTARAKGVHSTSIVFKHALRNAFIPVLTYIGPMIAGILTGSFVVETVFSIAGLGRYFVQSIQGRDYPIIMATTIFLAALVILMNLIVDILYKVIDPRIDVTKGGNQA